MKLTVGQYLKMPVGDRQELDTWAFEREKLGPEVVAIEFGEGWVRVHRHLVNDDGLAYAVRTFERVVSSPPPTFVYDYCL